MDEDIFYYDSKPDDLFPDDDEEPENGELQFIDAEEPDEEDVFSEDGTETDGEPEDDDNALPTDDGIDIGDVVP